MQVFPISEAQPPEHRAALPSSADVVVIGGGVIGVSASLFLARAGLRVTLLEKGRIAGEQSSRNWGWIRVTGRDLAEVPIALEAQGLWQKLAQEVASDIGLTQGGVAYLAESEADLNEYAAWLESAKPLGVSSELLDSNAVRDLMPQASRQWAGALWTPTDMRAEPFVAVPALARLARDAGVTIREACAARLIETEAGQVSAVVSEHGSVKTNAVVLAGGAWSSLFLRRHGLSIPQLSVRSTAGRTSAVDDVYSGGAIDGRVGFRRRQDGGYTLAQEVRSDLFIGPDAFRALPFFVGQLMRQPFRVTYRPAAPRHFPDAWGTKRFWRADEQSPFERMRVLNPRPNARATAKALGFFKDSFDAADKAELIQHWAGMIDFMPDMVPVVDQVGDLPGLTVATGMTGHGFGIGPAFGRIVADLVQGKAVGHDISRFRFSRFADGSRLVPGPGV